MCRSLKVAHYYFFRQIIELKEAYVLDLRPSLVKVIYLHAPLTFVTV